MRFLATLLLWLLTTAALTIAVPAVWAQLTIVDEDGYAALATSAAQDPRLQDAMAAELTTQVVRLGDGRGYPLNPQLVSTVASSYTQNSGFGGQFARANRIAHQWMFTGARPSGNSDRWLVDVAPMLSDPSFTATLGDLDLQVPPALTVPIAVDIPELQPGTLRSLATWGPRASGAAAVATAVLALLTLAAARSRAKALIALGVSALIAGAAGWSGIEIGRRYVNDALTRTTGDIRTVAEVMVGHAEESLHLWLNITLLAGGALVVIGAIAVGLGALWRSE